MKIAMENPTPVTGVLTLTVEEADYKEQVEKTLKTYRKKANVPGFRPGQVPMGMIKKMYGTGVKADEVNKLIGDKLYGYIRENNIQMLGEPMPNEKQEPQDIEKGTEFEFIFDIAIAPAFEISLTDKDTIDYLTINVDDDIINRQVDMYQSRAGQQQEVEEFQGNDMLKGDLRELNADGTTKEDGITVEAAVMMPEYFKNDDQKKLFEGAKKGDIISFNPSKAYDGNDVELSSLLKKTKEEVAGLEADFSYQITEIKRFVKAEVNAELFEQIYPGQTIESEADFRKKVGEDLAAQFVADSDFKFFMDVRKYAEAKVGELTFPDELLKRIMKSANKDKEEDYVEKNYEESIKQLKWHLIKEQLVKACEIKIEDEDVKNVAKAAARAQFAQYGMSNIPDEYLENYAQELLKKQDSVEAMVDRAIDGKLTAALKSVVKLNNKTVSLDEFNASVEA